MQIFKRILTFIISAFIIFSALPCTVFADTSPVITVSKKAAVPGDSVAINIDISGNPGFMAMTFGIKYNPSAFTYEGYAQGFTSAPTVNNDAAAGIVRFVSCESNNLKRNGTIVTVMFKVNDTAPPKEHRISVVNINYENYGSNLKGCFARYNAPAITPTAKSGSITVGATCTNSPHLFGEWNIEVEPSCEVGGLESHSCSRCSHTENRVTDPLGHSYEEEWTIDIEATEDSEGQMSRHCKNCEGVTDVIFFSLPEAESPDNDIENEEGEKVEKEDVKKLEDYESIADKDEEEDDTAEEPKSPIIRQETEGADNETAESENGKTAEEIVKNQQNEKDDEKDKAEKPSLYEYLFGNGEQKGVVAVIIDAIPDNLKTALKFSIIPIIILLLLAI